MKCLVRNKQTLYYRLWEGVQETVDEDGNIVETNVPVYSDPVKIRANVSVAEGQRFVESTSAQMFGLAIDYDKVIVLDDVNCPIEESTVFYIDKTPYADDGSITAYDYRVTRISKSLNSISIAVKKVDVS